MRLKVEANEMEYLCRFQSKSYLHIEWLTIQDVKKREILMMNVTRRMKEQVEEKLK